MAAGLSSLWPEIASDKAELVVCPSSLALSDVRQQLTGSDIKLGGQNLSLNESLGAYTGQIAGQHLQEMDAKYAIVGHSETRQFLCVTDQLVHQQVKVALAHQIIPIICIGETAEQRQAGRTDDVLVEQLQVILSGFDLTPKDFIVAYEPRWAISAVSGGKSVEPDEAARAHKLIKHALLDFVEDSQAVSVIYGGSVDGDNVVSFITQPGVDGVLIGSASSRLDSFKEILAKVKQGIG